MTHTIDIVQPDKGEEGTPAKPQAKPPATLATYDELGGAEFEFLASTPFIRRGYRVHYTVMDCVKSLFQLHNETWNVWIHLVGSLLFATMAVFFDGGAHPSSGGHLATWPVRVFHSAVAVSFACSSTYHLMYVQSRELSVILLQVDLAGIVVILLGVFVPMVYYSFHCDRFLQLTYLGVASLLGTITLVLTMLPTFRAKYFLRGVVYVGFVVITSVGPLVHLLLTVGVHAPQVKWMLRSLSLGLVLNLPGIATYYSQAPERWAPGAFDVWGSSHQWWHLGTLIAIYCYNLQVEDLYLWRKTTECVPGAGIRV